MDNNQIILTYKCCSLKRSDINCLSDYTYINDIMISFYYEILNEKFPSDKYVLMDPAVSMSIIVEKNLKDIKECIFDPLDLKSKNFVFVPINDNERIDYQTGGCHWALSIIDVNNNYIYYLDSLLSDIDNSHRSHKKLERLFGKKFAFEKVLNVKYQSNSYDCGMFVLGFTETILEYMQSHNFDKDCLSGKKFDDILKGKIKVQQENMRNFREDIKGLINKKIEEKKSKK